MSDENQGVPTATAHGWVKVYHPSGLQVSLPVGDVPYEYRDYFANVDAILAAGFLISPTVDLAAGKPIDVDLKPGEEYKTATHAVFFRHRKDGKVTPCVDLYESGQSKWKDITVYMDRNGRQPEDFEAASGMKITDMKPYIGAGHVERGADPDLDLLIYKLPRTVGYIRIPNKSYTEGEKKAKWHFQKWVTPGGGSAPASGQQQAGDAGGHDDSAICRMIDAVLNGCRSKAEVRDAGKNTIAPNAGKLTEASRTHYRDMYEQMLANPDIPEKTPAVNNESIPW